MRFYHTKTNLFKFAITLEDLKSYLIKSDEIDKLNYLICSPKALMIYLN